MSTSEVGSDQGGLTALEAVVDRAVRRIRDLEGALRESSERRDEAEALAIANATEYGLGAGVWTRDTNRAFRMGRGIKAGRVWMNNCNPVLMP